MLLTLMISGALHFTPHTPLPELSSAALVAELTVLLPFGVRVAS